MTSDESPTGEHPESPENSQESAPSVERPRGRPFEPGKSGNPGGRPKGIDRVRDLCRAKTELAVLTLASIMVNKRVNAGARVRAAQEILDRGWGKPNQPISGPDDGPIKFQDERSEINRKLETMLQAALAAKPDGGDKPDGG